jgi:hypothetical protein
LEAEKHFGREILPLAAARRAIRPRAAKQRSIKANCLLVFRQKAACFSFWLLPARAGNKVSAGEG